MALLLSIVLAYMLIGALVVVWAAKTGEFDYTPEWDQFTPSQFKYVVFILWLPVMAISLVKTLAQTLRTNRLNSWLDEKLGIKP